jgi:hypothetical protein
MGWETGEIKMEYSYSKNTIRTVESTKWSGRLYTQNIFEVNLTIVGVKIWHDLKWGCDNLVQNCMELLQPSKVYHNLVKVFIGLC